MVDAAPSYAVERAAVEVDRDRVAELVDRLVAGQRRRLTAAVGAADRHRAGPAQDLPGQRMVGNPERDRVLRVAEVHPQAGLDLADHRERSGPVLGDQVLGLLGHLDGQRPDQARIRAISTGGGMSRPRCLASSSRCTAAGLNASAPMP